MMKLVRLVKVVCIPSELQLLKFTSLGVQPN